MRSKKWHPNLSWRQIIGPKIIFPLPILHNAFFWKPNGRPQGISCIMRIKDEEDWIEMSMKSVVPLADELIVVDSGSQDRSYEIADELKKELPMPVKIFQTPELYFCDQSNFALSQTSYRWVMKWDADFIGHSDISDLREKILALPKGNYLVYPSIINLDGDLEHTIPREVLTTEGYIHYYRSHLKYQMRGRFESLQIPLYFKRIFIFKPYIFHLRSLKPAKRLLFRTYWTRWMGTADYKTYPKLEDFVQEKIKEEYHTDSIDEAIKLYVKSLCNQLIRYQPEECREYPDILNKARKNEKYKVIYEDGVPVGRNDVLD